MTSSNPFDSWGTDDHAARARALAQHIKQFNLRVARAHRHLSEAHTYYVSEQWKLDGIEAGTLDTLLNDLRQQLDIATRLRATTEDQLTALLQTQRDCSGRPIAERRDELLQNTVLPPLTGDIEPTPLEGFLAAHRPPQRHKARSRAK